MFSPLSIRQSKFTLRDKAFLRKKKMRIGTLRGEVFWLENSNNEVLKIPIIAVLPAPQFHSF